MSYVDSDVIVPVVLLTALVVGGLAYAGGSYLERKDMQKQAVTAGVAHYTADPQTGEVRFEWIRPEGAP